MQCTTNITKPKLVADSNEHYLLADRNTLLMRGYSTSFTDGYMDGCESGQQAAGDPGSVYIKNQEHAKLSTEYANGWEQGKNFCYTQMRDLIKYSGSDNPYIYRSKAAMEQEKQRIWAELKK